MPPAERKATVQGTFKMANTSSAKKAVRKIARRTVVNRARRSQMRTQVRKAEEALVAGDAGAAKPVVVLTESTLMRAAQKGVIHKNTAARRVAQLARKMKYLAQGAAATA